MKDVIKLGATILCLATSPAMAAELTLLEKLDNSPIADQLDSVSAQIESVCNRFNTIQSTDGNGMILLSSCQNAQPAQADLHILEMDKASQDLLFKQLESIGVYDRCFAITKPDNGPVEAFTVSRCDDPIPMS